MNSLIGIGLKRVTLGHPMPQGSYNKGQQEEPARNEVQEPLINQAKLYGDGRANSKPRVHFKQTEEELDYWNWTHVDKLGSSFHVEEKDDDDDDDDDQKMEKRNEFMDIDPSKNKEIPQLNGISLDTDKPQLHGKIGKNIIIPITYTAEYEGKNEQQKHQLDGGGCRVLVHKVVGQSLWFYCFSFVIDLIFSIDNQTVVDRLNMKTRAKQPNSLVESIMKLR